MIYLFSYILLIFIHFIPKTLSTGSSSIGLGSSACTYYGNIDKLCNSSLLPVENLPKECTSFIVDDLTMKSNSTLTDHFSGDGPKYLNKLSALTKPIFLIYARSFDDWNDFFDGDIDHLCVKIQDDMKSLHNYLVGFDGITGFILKGLDYSVDDHPSIYENLKMYLETMESSFPGFSIGLNVIGKTLIYSCYYDASECTNFDTIDQYVDFYVIDLINVNDCTADLKCTTSPLNYDEDYITLDMLTSILQMGIFPQNKVHFLYRGSPVYDGFDLCSTTYAELCTNQNNSWCADTQKSYVDKGQYASYNGAGFIVDNIDLIDPNSVCQCDHPFPAFYFLLNGFNNGSTESPCSLFDRDCTV